MLRLSLRLLVLASLWAGGAAVAAGASSAGGLDAKVDPGLQDLLAMGARSEGSAPYTDAKTAVIVLFHDPASGQRGAARWHDAAREKRIQAQARSIEDGLPPGTWEGARRYRSVAAMSGRVSARGLWALARQPLVRRIGPDHVIHGQAAEALPFVGADLALESYGLSGEGVTVAIFDSGIKTNHVDFEGRIISGRSFLNGVDVSDDIEDDHGHGTNVAGVLGAAGVIAPRGVASGATLLVYKVLDENNSGWASDWAAAVDDAAARYDEWPSLAVSNSSLESDAVFAACPCGTESAWIELNDMAYESLAARGVLNAACSGNDGRHDAMAVPSCLTSVLSVAAVYDDDYDREPDSGTYQEKWSDFGDCVDEETSPDLVTCFSNVSPCLDILAPGVRVRSADRFGYAFASFTGTSQAAPVVAGAAALLVEGWTAAELGGDAEERSQEIRSALITTGVVVTVPSHPLGSLPRVDIPAAIQALLPINPDSGPEATTDAIDAAEDPELLDASDAPDLEVSEEHLDEASLDMPEPDSEPKPESASETVGETSGAELESASHDADAPEPEADAPTDDVDDEPSDETSPPDLEVPGLETQDGAGPDTTNGGAPTGSGGGGSGSCAFDAQLGARQARDRALTTVLLLLSLLLAFRSPRRKV